MDRELYDKVSRWFDDHREEMTKDIMRLVRIPSVSCPQEGEEAPFGSGCRDCLEEMLALGQEQGFCTENYENRVGSIGSRDKDWDNMIGFWNHLDVVPVGNQWIYEPFEPVLKDYFLIGRGAQDNKGPAVGILYMMKCLRELEIPMKHQLRLFVGCDEERGMADMEYYTSRYPAPRLSMIADSGFPVCYGEKGIIEGSFHSREPVSDLILELAGGSASNMIPDAAYVVVRATDELAEALQEHMRSRQTDVSSLPGRTDAVPAIAEQQNFTHINVEQQDDTIRISATGKSKHSAFPEGSVNAIHELMYFLSELTSLPEKDRELFGRLAYLSEEYYGEHTGIAGSDEVSGRTTCAATVLKLQDRKVSLHFNIRYVITADRTMLSDNLSRTAAENGLVWETERDSAPNYFPKEHPAVQLLTDLYNEITGSHAESFVMGGGTYARKLPRAFAYGVGGMQESEEDLQLKKQLFLPGHGGAHEPDEGLNLRLLTEAMKIYTMAVIALNDCEI
ncbi:MAG: Sapep family Mn(2+)-dependent dipeptidase [Blautia sp.]|nr:Sapep family Mn(2+)-dependent dipeptidase [Blautia sp.]